MDSRINQLSPVTGTPPGLYRMSSKVFLQPVLKGVRFDGHALPLEFLADFSVLEDMLIEVAKWRFLSEHEDRQRTPRNFLNGVSLKLTGIEEGSARPVFTLFMAGVLFAKSQTYLEDARDSIISAIGAAQSNKAVTDHLPKGLLRYFDRFGRSLRDGESIEFATPGSTSHTIALTKESRRRLVLAAGENVEVTEKIDVYGTVPAADQGKAIFIIQFADGRRFPASMKGHHDEVIEAFNGFKNGTRVRLQGVGCFSQENRLSKIDAIDKLTVLDELDIAARLDELKALKPGWMDGQGEQPSTVGIDWLRDSFDTLYDPQHAAPYLYPTPNGGVRAEWSFGDYEVSLDIDLNGHKAFWHNLRVSNDEVEERELLLDIPGSWDWLNNRIGNLAGDAK